MDNLPLYHTKWSDRLAFDVALMLEGSGESLQEVIARHKIAAIDILAFNKDPIFLKKVEHYQNEVREKGLTFKLKARAQAEELLTTSYLLIHDPAVSPAVKADLIKSTVKWAGLEPFKAAIFTTSSEYNNFTLALKEAGASFKTKISKHKKRGREFVVMVVGETH